MHGLSKGIVCLVMALPLALGWSHEAAANIYQSQGFLLNLTVHQGESITINTSANPPTFNVAAFPIAANYQGRVVDGVAVFDFAQVTIAEGVPVTITGDRPLSILATGDMIIGAVFDVSAGVAGGGASGQGAAGGQGGEGGQGGQGGQGGPGGAGGSGASGLSASNPGNAGQPGAGGGSGSAGQSGFLGLSNPNPGEAGGDGYGNDPDTGGVGGASGENAGPFGVGGTGSTLFGSGGSNQPNVGAGGTVSQFDIFGEIVNVGNAGSAGQTGGAGSSPSGSDAAEGAAGAAGESGSDGIFLAPADDLLLAGGVGGGGGGAGAGGGGGGSGGGGGGGGGGSGGGGGGSTNGTIPIINIPLLVGGGGGGGGTSGRGGQGGSGGGGGGSGGNFGDIGGTGGPGIDGNSNTGGTGGNGSAIGTGGGAGSAGSGAAGGAGGAGGIGGSGGAGGAGGAAGGAIVFSARGAVVMLPEFAVNISASLPEPGEPGAGGGPGGAATPGSAGGSGGAGGQPSDVLGFGLPVGVGGNGGAGGASGGGGAGAAGGPGGPGGSGGFATPGMVKFHASVVVALTGDENSPVVLADNAAGADPEQNGRFTVISNMNPAAAAPFLPTFSTENIITGFTRNDSLLLGDNVYTEAFKLPWIGQLQGGPGTAGFLQENYWNRDAVIEASPGAPTIGPVRLVVLPANGGSPASVFDGYDQVFVINESGEALFNVRLNIAGAAPFTMQQGGVFPPLSTWTTTVPAGTAVELDFEYEEPDTVPPVITLIGASSITVEAGTPFVDPGATATDNIDGNLTASIVVTGSVNTAVLGPVTLTYSVQDSSGNSASVVRTVTVVDTTPPVITLIGASTMTVEAGTPFVDPGATATDSFEGNLTSAIQVTGSVNTNVLGLVTLTYTVADSSGNSAAVARAVTVVDTTPPVIALNGDSTMTAEAGQPFVDPGATASDSLEGDLTAAIEVVGAVNTTVLGPVTLTYTVEDSSGNSASVVRTVTVVDTTPPVITLVGGATILTVVDEAFNDPGATALDAFDGDLTAQIEVAGEVDTATLGSYELTYTVADSSGNAAVAVRTVQVVESGNFEADIVVVLTGQLIDDETGEPLACGIVELTGSDGIFRVAAVTDANGVYFFEPQPTDLYGVRVMAPGYAPVDADPIALEDVDEESEVDPIVVDFELALSAAPNRVNGIVTDEDTGEPLVGVLVRLFIDDELVADTFSCANGGYEVEVPEVFGALETLEVEIRFSLPNFFPKEREEVVDPEIGLVVDETLKARFDGPSAIIGSVRAVSGSEDSEPLPGARITLRGPINTSTQSDGEGLYSFDAILDGSYSVTASAPGFGGKSRQRGLSAGAVGEVSFELSPLPGTDPGVPGDVNDDGSVNAVDVQLVINAALGLTIDPSFDADINNDGVINAVDVQLVINAALGIDISGQV